MSNEIIIFIVAVFQGLVVLYIGTRLKKSIEHKFDKKLEEIRQAFSREMADLDRQDKFRLVALDEKMKAHQKAFKLAQQMYRNIHSSDDVRTQVQRDCEEFWDSYSLYLTDEARRAFREVQHCFNLYSVNYRYWNLNRKNPESSKRLEDAFNTIQDLPAKLISIVDREASGKTDYLKDERITPFEMKQKIENK